MVEGRMDKWMEGRKDGAWWTHGQRCVVGGGRSLLLGTLSSRGSCCHLHCLEPWSFCPFSRPSPAASPAPCPVD